MLRAATATTARRRITAVAATTTLFSLVNLGFEVVAPLWATAELGLSAGEWAHLRSLRMAGTFVGAAFLGIVAERVGARAMCAASCAGAALALAAMGLGDAGTVAVAMPLFGACISAVFVNLNVLTQNVSQARQGLANGIYRGVGAGMAIVAPTAAFGAAAVMGGYSGALLAGSMLLAMAGAMAFAYPPSARHEPPPVLTVLLGYVRALRRRSLIGFIVLEQLWWGTAMGLSSLAAIRLTRELGLADAGFGVVCTVAAVGGLVATFASGVASDRLGLHRAIGGAWLIASAAAVAMGSSERLDVSIAAYALATIAMAWSSAPASMWVSRAAGDVGQNAAFTVHKVVAAGVISLGLAVVAVAEPLVGIAAVLRWGGLLGVPLAVVLLVWGANGASAPAKLGDGGAGGDAVPREP